MSISIVIPLYNERENVAPLYQRLVSSLSALDRPWEVIFIDDGSTDGTDRQLQELAAADQRVKVIQFRRNYGQTAALQAGIRESAGDVIVTLDGDLQNDPADIPMMLQKLDEGYDVVHGWRKDRHDALFRRKIPSRIANWLISRATGCRVHDLGCSLRVLRREIAEELELYGEMHRFIPVLVHGLGGRAAEVVTRHDPRKFGRTKYGLGRTARVILDLITVQFLIRYVASPLKLFAMIGAGCGLLSGLAGLAALVIKPAAGAAVIVNPLLLLSVLGVVTALQCVGLGLLGEIGTRIYFGQGDRQHYKVRRRINLETRLQSFPREAATEPFPAAAADPSRARRRAA